MSRGSRICCGVVTIILIVIVVFVILGFTVFKPRDPEITARPVSLDNLSFNAATISGNVSIDMIITVVNKNYGSFTFGNNTASVTYRGDIVGEIPIWAGTAPARSKTNMTTYAVIMTSKLLTNPKVFADVISGNLTLSSDATLRGKVKMLKILKLKASVFTHCDMKIAVAAKTSESICYSKLKL